MILPMEEPIKAHMVWLQEQFDALNLEHFDGRLPRHWIDICDLDGGPLGRIVYCTAEGARGAILLDPTGNVVDGQHRLAAIAESRQEQNLRVVTLPKGYENAPYVVRVASDQKPEFTIHVTSRTILLDLPSDFDNDNRDLLRRRLLAAMRDVALSRDS